MLNLEKQRFLKIFYINEKNNKDKVDLCAPSVFGSIFDGAAVGV